MGPRYSVTRGRGPGQWYLMSTAWRSATATAARSTPAKPDGSPPQDLWLGRSYLAPRPLRFGQVRTAGLDDDAGSCEDCGVSYCARHWHLSQTGYGTCPLGHGRSLDPHCQPAEEDRAMPGDDDQQQLPSAASADPE